MVLHCEVGTNVKYVDSVFTIFGYTQLQEPYYTFNWRPDDQAHKTILNACFLSQNAFTLLCKLPKSRF